MLLAQLPLRNGKEAGEPGLRREKVVIPFVQAMVANVVANREQVAGLIKQKGEVHVRELTASVCGRLQRPNSVQGVQGSIEDCATETVEPVVDI